MSSTSIVPPKQGGNGPLIGAALVMLIAMGGLLYWKSSKDEPAPEPAPPPKPKPPPAQVFEQAPPPPPPEDPEDAGKPTPTPSKPVAKKPAATGGGPCSSPCEGNTTPAIEGALAAKAGLGKRCYDRALANNSALKGRMVVQVRVGATGSVCSTKVVQNTLGDPGVKSCVLQKFQGARFAQPKGGCVDVQVPISFKPPGK